MRHLQLGQKSLIKLNLSPSRIVEIECTIKRVESDRIALNFPKKNMDYAPYFEEGVEFNLVVYSNNGLKYIDSVVLDSPLSGDFVVDYYEKPDKNIQRRQFLRVDAELPIRLISGEQSYETTTLNISGGGVRFITNKWYEENKVYEVSLSLPNMEHPIQSNARIVKSLIDTEVPFAIVEFIDITEIDQNKIIKYCMQEDALRFQK